MEGQNGIPQNWTLTKLGKIIELAYGKSLPKNCRNLSGKHPVYGSNGIVGYHDSYLIKGPAIIVGRKGAAGIPTFAKDDCWAIDTTYYVLNFKDYDLRFIYYLLIKLRLNQFDRSTAIPGLNRDDAYSLDIGLPPLPEQHRIVAKIEALFSELDKGIECFKTAREQLKIYRQALLKNAFSGKLTEQWRAENQDKLENAQALLQRIQTKREQGYQQQLKDWEATGKQGGKPKAPKILPPIMAEELAELPELPKGWAWVRMIEACEAVVDCHNKTAPYQASGVPLVRTPSIRDMKLNFDDSIRYVSRETYEFWSKRCLPQPGDILFTREAPMGEAAIIPAGKLICMGQRIMLLRPGNVFLSAKYLLCATQNPFFKEAAALVAVGTGVKYLRVGDVERLTFPICSINEQLEIANQLDAQLSEADQLDQTLTTALQQAEALRQSILKKAFSGQLVQQDLSDEPASALLERIQAEKATLVTPIRKRNKYA